MTKSANPLFPGVRVALVGGGFMSVVHARAARAAGARLLGVTSRTMSGTERACRELGADISYRNIEELLADDRVDVVHICSPNSSHAKIAGLALEAGKNVICEKPLATSVEDAQALAELAERSALVAAVPFVYRFYPMAREARSRVQRGATGRIFSIHGSYLQDWMASADDDDWRVDPTVGGPSRAFADIGSHLVDMIEFVTGDRISRVVATTRTVHPNRSTSKDITTEDVAVLVFETDAGSVGTAHVSQVSTGNKNGLFFEIAGEKETLRFDAEKPDTLQVGGSHGFLSSARSDDLSPGAARYSVLPAGHPQGYQDAFNAFVADSYATIGGSAVDGLPTFSDGSRAVAITEAILTSHRTGDWVDTSYRTTSLTRS